jgi:hypothetical protein
LAERHAVTKKNVFWLASILIVLLLAIYIMVSTQVTQYNSSDLGLLTKLPITFWIGLSYLGALLYLGRGSERRTIIVVILISFYLFAIPVLMRENKAEGTGISYFFSYQGTRLLSTGHLNFNNLDSLNLLNWPGFFILAGFLSTSSGLQVTIFADYFPLLTMALLGIMAFKTLRLRLNTVLSSFGVLLFIASFYTGQNYFSPQGVAYIIYFALFFLLAKLFFTRKQNAAFSLIIPVLFIGLVTMHLLTSFVVVCGVFAVYILYRIFSQKSKMVFYSIVTCLLLLSIFLAYQGLVITQSFSGIAELLFSQFSRGETHLSTVSQGRAARSPALLLTLFSTYSITIVIVVAAAIAILTTIIGILIFKKEKARNDLFWTAWIIVAGVIGVSVFYGGEAIERAFILMLLPTCYFIVKFLSRKPQILILFIILIAFLQIPAHYTRDNFTYVPTSELNGTAFYARCATPGASFFYETNLASFPPPGAKGIQVNIQNIAGVNSLPSSELVNYTIGKADYVISSSEQRNLYQYFYGIDLLQNLSFDDHYNRVYDNEGFQIYASLNG